MLLASILLFVSSFVMALNIVATVPPLASMVNPLLDKDDNLTTLLTPGHTPHGFQLKPSHMLALERADIILTVGTGVDAWASKALERWPEKVISMVDLPGLVKLEMRSQADWRINLISDDEEGHGHKHSHKHGHKHSHAGHSNLDPHIWLSPDNARLMIESFAQVYSKTISANSEKVAFDSRVQQFLSDLEKVDLNIKQQLSPISDRAFIVLHDAFQYFQLHYNLNGVGAIQISPKLKPSLNKLLKIQDIMAEKNVVCVFKEPQLPYRQVEHLVRGVDVRVGSLDPLGGRSENVRHERYDVFIQTLADQFEACLK